MEKILLTFSSGLLFLLISLILFWRFSLRRETERIEKETEEKFSLLSRQWSESLDRNTQLITTQLNSLQSQITQNLISASSMVQNVQKTLGKLEEGTKQIFEVGKDIASFQELLRQPKFRGEFGQFLLENVLEQIIPKEYYLLQYRFRNGETADAVIKIGENLVVVDAKFPLESFKRIIEAKVDAEKLRARKDFQKAINKHIDDIAQKYILPDEGTYDFALMYIPAENVYYETIIKESEEMGLSIREHALNKKVIPVSPNSFYAYLMVILRGLKGLTIEKRAKEVLETIARLRNDFLKFSEEFSKTGMHLKNASQSYERAVINLERLDDKFKQIESPAPDSGKVIPHAELQNNL